MNTYIFSPVIKRHHEGGGVVNNLISFPAIAVLTVFNQNYCSQKVPNRQRQSKLSLNHKDDYLFSKAAMLDCSPTGPL